MKKTLIFHGSPRKNGDTAAMVERLVSQLDGEVFVERVFGNGIGSCLDCRVCRKKSGCALEDGMARLYTLIEECDNVVIASPVWYGTLTGRLLEVMSRLQTYFSAEAFRNEKTPLRAKRGGIMLAYGGNGGENNAEYTARVLLKSMNAQELFPTVFNADTDSKKNEDDSQIKALAEFLNK